MGGCGWGHRPSASSRVEAALLPACNRGRVGVRVGVRVRIRVRYRVRVSVAAARVADDGGHPLDRAWGQQTRLVRGRGRSGG